ncbi:hypothetical protein [Spirosoma endbachense]|uniref:Uncharacterized protein n=1 Tax=Spirosoma endbachense TaxID=2666025 RepID=A0A6P1W3E9_9BACT|nr:hypothetical protein [Spirosoma endbachense]QHV99414.1 hypothetical protein GJR95_32330 [Spirosoma endbachense]
MDIFSRLPFVSHQYRGWFIALLIPSLLCLLAAEGGGPVVSSAYMYTLLKAQEVAQITVVKDKLSFTNYTAEIRLTSEALKKV